MSKGSVKTVRVLVIVELFCIFILAIVPTVKILLPSIYLRFVSRWVSAACNRLRSAKALVSDEKQQPSAMNDRNPLDDGRISEHLRRDPMNVVFHSIFCPLIFLPFGIWLCIISWSAASSSSGSGVSYNEFGLLLGVIVGPLVCCVWPCCSSAVRRAIFHVYFNGDVDRSSPVLSYYFDEFQEEIGGLMAIY